MHYDFNLATVRQCQHRERWSTQTWMIDNKHDEQSQSVVLEEFHLSVFGG